MPLSNSRIASSIGGQHSSPRSVLGEINTGSQFKLGDPLEKAQAGLRSAAQTAGGMQQTGRSTQVTDAPGQEKSIAGGLAVGISGLTAGATLTGGIAAASAASIAAGGGMAGIGPALLALGPVGWALGAASIGAYLFS